MKGLRIIFFILTLFCYQCSPDHSQTKVREWRQPNGKVKVLSTIAMIDDLAKQVGGEWVDTLPLIKGELDPHSYQLVKGDDEKLAFADVIFFNGLRLEHGPSLQEYLEKSPKAIGLGNLIMEKEPNLLLHYRGQPDPHIWMDASLWAKTLPYIVEALSSKDPAHAQIFQQNGEKLQRAMEDLHAEIHKEMQEIPESQRYLVTSHDAFNYFTRAYLASKDENKQADWQKRFAAPEGLAPDSQLSVTDIQHIIDHLKMHHIHVLFPESNVSRDSIKKIVGAGKEIGLSLTISQDPLYADAMGSPGSDGDSYIKMIQHNGKVIASHLRNNHP